MRLSHEFTVPAGPDETWALLTDLDKVGSCFPGATVTDADDDSFSGTVKVKLGPIAMLYAGSGRFVERDDAAHTAVIEAQGKDKRGNGTAGATVTLRLLREGQRTRAEVGTDLNVTGKPAQFGRGVMQDVSDKLLGQFIDCIEEHLGGGSAAGPAADTTASAAPATGPSEPLAPTTGPSGGLASSAPAEAGPPPVKDDAIELGAAVLPVLARRYRGYALAGLIGLVLGRWLGHRRGGLEPS